MKVLEEHKALLTRSDELITYAQIAYLCEFVYNYFIDIHLPLTMVEASSLAKELAVLVSSGKLLKRKFKRGYALISNGVISLHSDGKIIRGAKCYGVFNNTLTLSECEGINAILKKNMAHQIAPEELKKSIVRDNAGREDLINKLKTLVLDYKIKVDLDKTDQELQETLSKILSYNKKTRENKNGTVVIKNNCLVFEEKSEEKGIVVDGVKFKSVWDEI